MVPRFSRRRAHLNRFSALLPLGLAFSLLSAHREGLWSGLGLELGSRIVHSRAPSSIAVLCFGVLKLLLGRLAAVCASASARAEYPVDVCTYVCTNVDATV